MEALDVSENCPRCVCCFKYIKERCFVLFCFKVHIFKKRVLVVINWKKLRTFSESYQTSDGKPQEICGPAAPMLEVKMNVESSPRWTLESKGLTS